ncbi:MAG: thiamine pyrophosphate-binding protein [Pseudomonadota bacterium]
MEQQSHTGAAIIGAKLKQAGCKHAFGIPGGEVLAILEGLDQAGIKFHLTKHENAAGFMAEGAWHAEPAGSRAPAILVATIGPGVANAVNVIANAMQDRVPMIFLTGCVETSEGETYTHQVFDHQAMLRPIVKASFRASEGTVGVMMEKALAIAFDGQPGPVHVDVPIGVAENVSNETLQPLMALPAHGTAEGTPAFSQAVEALLNAERPLVIAGVDAVNEGASDIVTQFCNETGIALVTSYKGKGLLDENSVLSLGGHGLSPKSDRTILPLIKQADCILLMGYDPIEMRTGWRNPWGDEAIVIDIAPSLRTHGMHRTNITLAGNCTANLSAMLSAVADQLDKKKGDWQSWTETTVREAHQSLADQFDMPNDWGPGQVFGTLNACLPADVVITADSGAHRILLSQMWTSATAHTFLQSSALCTMGCAVPLAAGYKVANPETPVCAFVGDAGLEMGLGELATLRDMEQPILICVLVDESLALIELKQRNTQRKNLGVDFGATDFPAVAKALGGHGVLIEDQKTLQAEAKDALQRNTFTVLACKINRRAYDGTF